MHACTRAHCMHCTAARAFAFAARRRVSLPHPSEFVLYNLWIGNPGLPLSPYVIYSQYCSICDDYDDDPRFGGRLRCCARDTSICIMIMQHRLLHARQPVWRARQVALVMCVMHWFEIWSKCTTFYFTWNWMYTYICTSDYSPTCLVDGGVILFFCIGRNCKYSNLVVLWLQFRVSELR